jgi:hypothetical protein
MPLRLVGVVFPVEFVPMDNLFLPAIGFPHPEAALADPTGLLTLVVRLLVEEGFFFFVAPPPEFRLPNILRTAFMASSSNLEASQASRKDLWWATKVERTTAVWRHGEVISKIVPRPR